MLRKVFVYGSLRTDMFNYEKYLKGEVLESTPAKIKGNLFHIENKGYPAIFDGESEIIGEVFTFHDFSKVSKHLMVWKILTTKVQKVANTFGAVPQPFS